MDKVFRDPFIISYIDKKKGKLYLDLIIQEMQRLRRIRQLGLSYVTYLGAEHSRFAHSVGCAHLMGRMINKLEQLAAENEYADLISGIGNYRELLICAALLHDIGHGPFSHAIEKQLGKKHESWATEIILNETTQINSILKRHRSDYPQKVSEIIAKVFTPRYVVKLLSSQMDVDKMLPFKGFANDWC